VGQATDDNMTHAHCMLDTNKQSEYAISVFHGNKGCTTAPQYSYYVIRTLSVLSVPHLSPCMKVKNVFTLYFHLMCSTELPSGVYLQRYVVWCTYWVIYCGVPTELRAVVYLLSYLMWCTY